MTLPRLFRPTPVPQPLRWGPSTATVTPPALHHCPVCDCEGTATTCWCCGTTTGEG